MGDTLLSVGVLIGFLVAYALVAAGRADLAAYVDPGMVTLVSLAFLWVPTKLIISSMREILSMAPEADVLDQLHACIAAVEERYAFSESFLRASKVETEWTSKLTSSSVRNRRSVRSPTAIPCARTYTSGSPHWGNRSVVVTFTADRRWAV